MTWLKKRQIYSTLSSEGAVHDDQDTATTTTLSTSEVHNTVRSYPVLSLYNCAIRSWKQPERERERERERDRERESF